MGPPDCGRRGRPGGVPPGRVSLRRCGGSRNRPLAALARGGRDLFLFAGGFRGAGFADAVLLPAGKHLSRLGPAGVRAPSSRRLPPKAAGRHFRRPDGLDRP